MDEQPSSLARSRDKWIPPAMEVWTPIRLYKSTLEFFPTFYISDKVFYADGRSGVTSSELFPHLRGQSQMRNNIPRLPFEGLRQHAARSSVRNLGAVYQSPFR